MKIKRIDIKGNLYDVEAFISPIPVGTVLHFAGNTEPEGFLFTEGQEVLRNAYPNLFAAIGTTYGEGDGETTFNLPDYREVVFVGVGQNAKLDIKAHDVYELGQFKDDQSQGHHHFLGNRNGERNTTIGTQDNKGASLAVAGQQSARGIPLERAIKIISDDSNGQPRIGSTTHGKQIGIRYIIKY